MTAPRRDPITVRAFGINPEAGATLTRGPLDVAAIRAWTVANMRARGAYHSHLNYLGTVSEPRNRKKPPRLTEAGRVRLWARRNGVAVPNSGVIPFRVQRLYDARAVR